MTFKAILLFGTVAFALGFLIFCNIAGKNNPNIYTTKEIRDEKAARREREKSMGGLQALKQKPFKFRIDKTKQMLGMTMLFGEVTSGVISDAGSSSAKGISIGGVSMGMVSDERAVSIPMKDGTYESYPINELASNSMSDVHHLFEGEKGCISIIGMPNLEDIQIGGEIVKGRADRWVIG